MARASARRGHRTAARCRHIVCFLLGCPQLAGPRLRLGRDASRRGTSGAQRHRHRLSSGRRRCGCRGRRGEGRRGVELRRARRGRARLRRVHRRLPHGRSDCRGRDPLVGENAVGQLCRPSEQDIDMVPAPVGVAETSADSIVAAVASTLVCARNALGAPDHTCRRHRRRRPSRRKKTNSSVAARWSLVVARGRRRPPGRAVRAAAVHSVN